MDTVANERREAVSGTDNCCATLALLLALALTACDTVPPDPEARTAHDAARTNSPSRLETKGAQVLVAPSNESESPLSTAQPVAQQKPLSQQSGPRSEPKPLSPIASTGVEKPAALHMSNATAASAKPAPKSRPIKSPATVERISDPDASAPVAGLIVKGTPHREPPRSPKKWLLWVGLGLAGSVAVALVTFSWVRRGQLPKAPEGKKLDPMRANGLLMKEPLSNS